MHRDFLRISQRIDHVQYAYIFWGLLCLLQPDSGNFFNLGVQEAHRGHLHNLIEELRERNLSGCITKVYIII